MSVSIFWSEWQEIHTGHLKTVQFQHYNLLLHCSLLHILIIFLNTFLTLVCLKLESCLNVWYNNLWCKVGFLIKSYFYTCWIQSGFDGLLAVTRPLGTETRFARNGFAGTLEWQQHCAGAVRLRPPFGVSVQRWIFSIPLVLHVHLLLGKGFWKLCASNALQVFPGLYPFIKKPDLTSSHPALW